MAAPAKGEAFQVVYKFSADEAWDNTGGKLLPAGVHAFTVPTFEFRASRKNPQAQKRFYWTALVGDVQIFDHPNTDRHLKQFLVCIGTIPEGKAKQVAGDQTVTNAWAEGKGGFLFYLPPDKAKGWDQQVVYLAPSEVAKVQSGELVIADNREAEKQYRDSHQGSGQGGGGAAGPQFGGDQPAQGAAGPQFGANAGPAAGPAAGVVTPAASGFNLPTFS